MIEIGKINQLRVVKHVDFGVYLDGGDEYNEILLPRRYVPNDCQINDTIDVFIYFDSEDRIIATTETPFAMVGDFAALLVKSASSIGAFLDLGLQKDLLVPFSEQKLPMTEGETYVVYLYVDELTKRIVGSAKLDKFLKKTPGTYQEGQQVDLLICQQTDLGYKAIINNTDSGLLYKGEVFQPLAIGEKIKGFVNKVRDDGKIDLILHKPGYEKVNDISTLILDKLKREGGFIAVTDKSPSEIIYKLFGVSKKTYKKAVGALFKDRHIAITDKGIKIPDEKR
ncbi:MAG: GntR family transcriptional regulator [Bacteroidetes bacterium]|nr:GntR family transcriptional regulator [Bacteroidota bacterium]